ncbi:MAG TPA: hypothetical protein VLB73_04190 [Patescibacteria group bacterium]|nr:hypothetical protein [Patescibacteria group bacterium]
MTLIASIIIFLFSLFVLSKEDFVFLRKNISLQTIFDTACLVGLASLFFSRLIFVLLHPSFAYINPFIFFIIPYFPGLTTSGFLIGGSLALYLFSMRQKLPLGKLFDVFSLSVLPSSATFFLVMSVIFLTTKHIGFSALFLAIFLLLFISTFLLRTLAIKFSWEDGSVSLFALSLASMSFFISSFINSGMHILFAELSYFLFFFFLLFLSFLVKSFRKTRQS